MFEANVRRRQGFALRDLLILMVLIVTAVGLVLCSLPRADNVSARTVTMNCLSQCAKAVHFCHDQYKTYPPYFGPYGTKTTPYTFHVHLLPLVDQAPLYAKPDPKGVVAVYLSAMDPTTTDNGANACNFPVNLRLYFTERGLGALTQVQRPRTSFIPRCLAISPMVFR